MRLAPSTSPRLDASRACQSTRQKGKFQTDLHLFLTKWMDKASSPQNYSTVFSLLHTRESIFSVWVTFPALNRNLHIFMYWSLPPWFNQRNTHSNAHGSEQAYHSIAKGHHVNKDVRPTQVGKQTVYKWSVPLTLQTFTQVTLHSVIDMPCHNYVPHPPDNY